MKPSIIIMVFWMAIMGSALAALLGVLAWLIYPDFGWWGIAFLVVSLAVPALPFVAQKLDESGL